MEDTLKLAIEKYGVRNQLDQVTEECGELITAINKAKRAALIGYKIRKPHGNTPIKQALVYYNLCSEVADVRIMLKQMELMLDKDTIDLCEQRKVARLQKELNKKKVNPS